jgi:hypothetical protein
MLETSNAGTTVSHGCTTKPVVVDEQTVSLELTHVENRPA